MHEGGECPPRDLANIEACLRSWAGCGSKRVTSYYARQIIKLKRCKLTRPVRQSFIKLNPQTQDVVRQTITGKHFGTGPLRGSCRFRIHFDADVATRNTLASQDVATAQLVFRQYVGSIGQFFDLTVQELAFASGATAHLAAIRESYAVAQCSGEDCFLWQDLDLPAVNRSRDGLTAGEK